MIARTNTTADTVPINEHGYFSTRFGQGSFDQLIAINQIFAFNDRFTDLDYDKGVILLPRFMDRKRCVGWIVGKILGFVPAFHASK